MNEDPNQLELIKVDMDVRFIPQSQDEKILEYLAIIWHGDLITPVRDQIIVEISKVVTQVVAQIIPHHQGEKIIEDLAITQTVV